MLNWDGPYTPRLNWDSPYTPRLNWDSPYTPRLNWDSPYTPKSGRGAKDAPALPDPILAPGAAEGRDGRTTQPLPRQKTEFGLEAAEAALAASRTLNAVFSLIYDNPYAILSRVYRHHPFTSIGIPMLVIWICFINRT
ncbi:hypothetical protein DdX_16059 [Ditylenchus destructor]|uniref:Uncharacterized protein n=1 Tax=Ditylenchus destructor TaxID=166010 RepID=A0AAD4MTS3_9BILA|nr:hypothetical protein DdX_16059 [Ditylenchus destructor]